MPAIDFTKIIEVASIAIRRSSIFMGLGVNAAESDNLRDYDLSAETKLRVVPQTNDQETLSTYKAEFRAWIIANGLRELHEGFTDFLERLHDACLTLGLSVGAFTPEQCDKLHKSFHRDGFPDKFEMLRKRFRVGTEHEPSLLSINAARNCFTHRRGRVGQKDLTDGQALVLTWKSIDFYITPTGQEPILTDNICPSGLPTPDGGEIEARPVVRELKFLPNSYIEFTPRHLADLCFAASEAANQLAASAVEYARGLGVKINEPGQSDEN